MATQDEVFLRKNMPTVHRNPIGSQDFFVFLDRLHILSKAIPTITNGGDAQAYHQLGLGGGIAHKIAV